MMAVRILVIVVGVVMLALLWLTREPVKGCVKPTSVPATWFGCAGPAE